MNVLEDRRKTHGMFEHNARIAQQLKSVLHAQDGWRRQSVETREALDMICSKMSRILSGRLNELDNWVDIQGYASLVQQSITQSAQFAQEEDNYL